MTGGGENCDLYLLGSGIAFPDHLTNQTVGVLYQCRQIYSNLADVQLSGLPRDLRSKCVSITSFYSDGGVRRDSYEHIAAVVLEAVENVRPVGWLTQGHPLIFDSVSQALVKAANEKGWKTRIVPAVSCIDTILAEVAYDPANGLLVADATAAWKQRIRLGGPMAVMLLQPSVFNSDFALLTDGHEGHDLRPLREYLLEFYPPRHGAAFVRSSATGRGVRGDIVEVPVGEIATVPFSVVAGTSLFLPPGYAGSAPDGLPARRDPR